MLSFRNADTRLATGTQGLRSVYVIYAQGLGRTCEVRQLLHNPHQQVFHSTLHSCLWLCTGGGCH